jgi:hypothetical protein
VQDPLKTDGPVLFAEVNKLISGAPLNIARDIAVSILLNALRTGFSNRKDAEAAFDEIMGRAKTLLLDVHYDSVTGKRREVFPYTHVVSPPTHVEKPRFD